jgi:DNA-binding XRE family transcriptional regulator
MATLHVVPASANGTIPIPRDDIKQRRRQLGLSQRELAEIVGSHAQTVDKIERGHISFSRYLEGIERHLGIRPTPPEMKHAEQGVDKIPVYATSAVTQRAAVMHQDASEPAHFVVPPTCLRGKRSAYGGLVSSDAMAPIFQCGDAFYCDAHLAPAPGKFVLLRQKPPWQRGEIMLCQLLGFDEWWWRVLLLNSGKKPLREKRLTLSRADYPICHRVVSKDFG